MVAAEDLCSGWPDVKVTTNGVLITAQRPGCLCYEATVWNLSSMGITQIEKGALSGMDRLEILILDKNPGCLTDPIFDGFEFPSLINKQKNVCEPCPVAEFPEFTVQGHGGKLIRTEINSENGCYYYNGTVLNLSNMGINELPMGIFADLNKLEELDLQFNAITEVPAKLFEGLENKLKKIYLNYNAIIELPSTLFEGLTNLNLLELSSNEINTLPEGLFVGLEDSLVELYLSNNEITELPSKIFLGLAKLKILETTNNEITVLPESVFVDLHSLTKLMLNSNKIR